jgi:putative salt-induced outer membrane protein
MFFTRRRLLSALTISVMSVSTGAVHAQEWDFATQLELGAVFTSGNTKDENVRFKGQFDAVREQWAYRATMDGFRSSKQNELAAQRLYTVGSATYSFDPDNFVMTRASHEDDRFSGYKSQSDLSVSYGQVLLRDRETISLRYTVGGGVRSSRGSENGTNDFREAIVRLSADYSWEISSNARFIQTLSSDIGEQSTISRSESSIESDIMSNLSMKFTVKVRNQSEVPVNREKTDTETSVTLLLRF